jgi:diamine N-acetyltransferase
MSVTLEEVTRDSLEAVLKLEVAEDQRGFVATNSKSIAQAHFWPDVAWFRAICLDGEPVGFVMLAFEPDEPPYVWRYMIDAAHQGQGLGRQAMASVVAAVRVERPGATELMLSHVPADSGPGPFYEKLGFVYTGAIHEGEQMMRLAL